MILVDTNVLLRVSNPNSPQFPSIVKATAKLLQDGEQLVIAPQSIYEMWVVFTRPVAQNGFELSPPEVRRQIENIRLSFSLATEPPDLVVSWLDLVTRYNVKGKTAHDARLVALMLFHSIPRVLTLNKQDFSRYKEITSISPEELSAVS